MHLVTCCTRVRDFVSVCVCKQLLYIYSICCDCCIGVRRPSDATQLHSSLHGVRGGIPRPKSKKRPDRKGYDMAAGNYTLPPPAQLEIHSDRAGEKWKRFKRAWDSYALVSITAAKRQVRAMTSIAQHFGSSPRTVILGL